MNRPNARLLCQVLKICQNCTFEVKFLRMLIHQRPFSFFLFSFKNINLGDHFLVIFFPNFYTFYFLKFIPIFVDSALGIFPKYNNFLGVCWFLAKHLALYVGPPKSKLHIPTDVRLHVNCQAYNYMACALKREKNVCSCF